ncbi:unnamed protein product, partial [marine sediment metagenome]
MKIGPDQYIMWYSGIGTGAGPRRWTVGIATASHPLGPGEKREGDPIIDD